jgi:pimeloyl-ACP methyl ester carboxylesterase
VQRGRSRPAQTALAILRIVKRSREVTSLAQATAIGTAHASGPGSGQDRILRLAGGRGLGFTDYGPADGFPVLFFHGFGTTRVICPPVEPAAELGLRLIAVDRPGIGLSEPMPGRRLLDWPADVAAVADELGLQKFSIVGWSGGGPYAMACAVEMPERVRSIALVSSPAPLAGGESGYLRRFDRHAVRAASRTPWIVRLAMWQWGRSQRKDAARFFDESVADMCAEDQAVLAEPELRDRMIANSAELYRQGGRGMYDEALILARPWGFELSDVKVPVDIWYGVKDGTVPEGMTAHLARNIEGAELHQYADEGHHLLYSHWPRILAALT